MKWHLSANTSNTLLVERAFAKYYGKIYGNSISSFYVFITFNPALHINYYNTVQKKTNKYLILIGKS